MWNKCNKCENKCFNDKIQTTSESSSTSRSSSLEEVIPTTKLDILLTVRGLQIYGTWSKEKLLKLLTNKIKQCIDSQSNALKKVSRDNIDDKRLWITVHNGIYSSRVVKELLNKGMPIHNVVKAMKLGLISLSNCELHFFRDFKTFSYLLEYKEMWTDKFSDELILNLRPTGLSEQKCWNIVIYGVSVQNPIILRHLILSGIDIPGILNWQSPINFASPKIIEFLRLIGIEENDVKLVEQFGIDDETEQMLVDLGLNHINETSSNTEEIICECSLTILEPSESELNVAQICKTDSSLDDSSYTTIQDDVGICCCQCHILEQNKTEDEVRARKIDYLRQNVMVPLTWAIARTLRYKPTDPLHYLGYQLLRWVCENVPQRKKDDIHQISALSTMVTDHKLIMRKRKDEEELIRIQNMKAMKNIPCKICMEHQELRRVKKQCWACVKRSLKTSGSCDFPHICSSCRINLSGKINSISSLHPLKSTVCNFKFC